MELIVTLSWEWSGVSEEQCMMTPISPKRDDLNPGCFSAAGGEKLDAMDNCN